MSSSSDRPLGVTVLALLAVLSALLLLCFAAMMARPDLAFQSSPRWLVSPSSSKQAPYVALLALFPGAIGFGLWYLQNWARMITIAFSLLGSLGYASELINSGTFVAAMRYLHLDQAPFAPRLSGRPFAMALAAMVINASVALYLMRPAVAKAFQEAW